jgi:hypothetical protein
MYQQEIRFVDLKNSKYDKEKSDRQKADYAFTKKAYVNYRSDASVRPPYYFDWCRYDARNNYRELAEWGAKWKFTPLTTADDYYPEGVPPNSSGNFVNGDVIAVKCPLMEQINKRKQEMRISENAPLAIKRQFQVDAKSMGVDLDDSQLDKFLANRG